MASHSDDLQIGSEIIINGKRYIEYMLNVDLDVSDNISYGNQYEFYIKTYSKQWVETTPEVYQNTKRTKIEVNQNIYDEVQIDLLPNAEETEALTCIKVTIQVNQETTYKYYKLEYMPDIEERVLPLVTSWGSSQGLSGFQMLRNNLLSPEQLEKSQLVHNVATTRGWAITFTFQLNDNKNAIVEMFSETLPRKDYLQRPYKLKALYKKKATNGEEVTFETLNKLSFETLLIPQEVATEQHMEITLCFLYR